MKHTIQELFAVLLLDADKSREKNADRISIIQNALFGKEPVVMRVKVQDSFTVLTAYAPIEEDANQPAYNLPETVTTSHRQGLDFHHGIRRIKSIPSQYAFVEVPDSKISCENSDFLLFLFKSMEKYRIDNLYNHNI
jgi:hypothetical protein